MHPNTYVKNVLITESNNFEVISSRFSVQAAAKEGATPDLATQNQTGVRNIRLLHAAIGISTEVGELFEFLTKSPLDFTNLKEEVGDALWYCGIATDELKLDLEQMVQAGKTGMTAIQGLAEEAKPAALLQMLIAATKDANTLLDLLKKSAFYGKSLDQEKFAHTLTLFIGSMMATLALGGFTLEEAMEVNIAKLQKRYGNKFSEAAAINRNLDAERKILEGELGGL